MIIAIDGTSASGKSTVAKIISERLSFEFLNTGIIYRKITMACLKNKIDHSQIDQITKIAKTIKIEDLSEENLHIEEISKKISSISK